MGIKSYKCSWAKLPENLKTKTSLNRMGIYEIGPVVAQIQHYENTYNLYNVETAIQLEQKRGNKLLSINSSNKDGYVIMEMATTGELQSDEIIQLVIIDMDGKLLFNSYVKPEVEISPSAYKKHNINKFFLKQQGRWADRWNYISEIIKDRVLLIPDTSVGVRLLKQTCSKYNIDMDFQINAICSKETIQHKFSLLSLFSLSNNIVQNPISDCFETLSILYPKAEIYNLRVVAKNYFDTLCNYKLRLGDANAVSNGYLWLKSEFKLSSDELDFNQFSFETCKNIINYIDPILTSLKLKPQKRV